MEAVGRRAVVPRQSALQGEAVYRHLAVVVPMVLQWVGDEVG